MNNCTLNYYPVNLSLLLNFASWTHYRVKLYRSENPSNQSFFLRKMLKSNLQVCSAPFWLFKYPEKQEAFHHCLSYCKAWVKIYAPRTAPMSQGNSTVSYIENLHSIVVFICLHFFLALLICFFLIFKGHKRVRRSARLTKIEHRAPTHVGNTRGSALFLCIESLAPGALPSWSQ